MIEPGAVGLCLTCRWMHRLTTRRGSSFFRCGRADSDASFPRYPPLPVRACAGYEPRSAAGEPAREGPVEHG
jgi:hypothetical protein